MGSMQSSTKIILQIIYFDFDFDFELPFGSVENK
jgi:hypothetical protein